MGRSLDRKIAAHRAKHPEVTHTQARAAVLRETRPRTPLERAWDEHLEAALMLPSSVLESAHCGDLWIPLGFTADGEPVSHRFRHGDKIRIYPSFNADGSMNFDEVQAMMRAVVIQAVARSGMTSDTWNAARPIDVRGVMNYPPTELEPGEIVFVFQTDGAVTWDGVTFTPHMIDADRHIRESNRLDAIRAESAAASVGWDALRTTLNRADGGAATLDTAQTSQGGTGPHGAVVGCPSEVFDALVEKFADNHPAAVQVTTLDLRRSSDGPHISARCELARDYVRRLAQERENRLNAVGAPTVTEYRSQVHKPPLPYMILGVRVTADVVNDYPAASDLLHLITRIGRALGLHLLLEIDDIDQVAERAFAEHIGYVISPSDIAGVVRLDTLNAPGVEVVLP